MKGVAIVGTLWLSVSAAGAVSYDLAVDVPSTLGGSDYTPNEIVRSDDAAYGLDLALPGDVRLGALHRTPDDLWLFSPGQPVELGSTVYEPRDVVAYDGSVYSVFQDGSAAGIPEGARIDAVLLDGAGRAVLSFDVPVEIGGTVYGRSDLVVREAAGFSLYWDADAAGVPPGSNLVGAAEDDAGFLVVSFDVPTDLETTTYLPGELVRWEGGTSFGSYFRDTVWPPGSQLRDFSFAPVAAGFVPDGAGVPGTPLEIGKAAAGEITLAWGPSCLGSDNDYEVYEGTVGDFTDHVPVSCSTGGATSLTFTPASTSSYYLVVPRNGMREGSYGRNSTGVERARGISACLIQEIGTCD